MTTTAMEFWRTAFLGFQTLGSIYGDIGTSPLYVFTGIFSGSIGPSTEEVVGAASCIVWSLTLIPLVKYSWLVIRASNDKGEGGTFILYMLLGQSLHFEKYSLGDISQTDPVYSTLSGTLESGSEVDTRLPDRSWIGQFKVFRVGLLIWTLLGASCVIADGLLTPAVSVVSAVSGLAVREPVLSPLIIPLSVVIIILLCGTKHLSLAFAPVVALWFIMLVIIGAINIARYDPAIFRVYNPAYAFSFLRSKGHSVLSGILLSITGVEALFADLGHYNRPAIQWTLTIIVYPSLVVTYLGQAAALTVHPDWISNTFYRSTPGGAAIYWLVFVLATFATIIASQAMILGAFSIIDQAIHLECFPRIKVIHTDPNVMGRVYIPAVNWCLMAIVILVCVGFGSGQHIINAYGFAVATVMFVTTTLLAMVMYFVWEFALVFPVLFFIIFGGLELAFWGSTIQKIPQGAWFPCVVGFVMTSFMLFWTWRGGRGC